MTPRLEENFRLDAEFSMGVTDISALYNRPLRLDGCVVVFCRRGRAEIAVDILDYPLRPGSCMTLLPGSILSLTRSSGNLHLDYIYLSEELFREATHINPAEFFRFVKENPVIRLSPAHLSFLNRWIRLMYTVHTDTANTFRQALIRNQLQCLFLQACDKMSAFFDVGRKKTRRQDEIFHDFMALVKTHCRTRRDVDFYAVKLFVSPRYLSFVCTKNAYNLSAKKVIDLRTILEIKILLETTKMPVQKIAEELCFPDQSYLGRFFKRYTGESPLAYRFRKAENK